MKTNKHPKSHRRVYPEELKKEAVQMLLEGHSASSVAHNLCIGHTSLLYRWKARSSVKKDGRPPLWSCEYGSPKSNSAAPNGSATS
jgi:transposase-like protein